MPATEFARTPAIARGIRGGQALTHKRLATNGLGGEFIDPVSESANWDALNDACSEAPRGEHRGFARDHQ